MHRNKKQCLAEQVRRFRARFVQSVATVLGEVIPEQPLIKWVGEAAGAAEVDLLEVELPHPGPEHGGVDVIGAGRADLDRAVVEL